MLGIDPRAAKATWSAALVLLALYAAYALRDTLFLFLLALLVSYVVCPLVDALHRRWPRRSRGALALIAFLLLVAALAAALALAGPPLAEQASHFGEQWRRWAADPRLLDRLPLPGWLEPYRERILALLRRHFEGSEAVLLPAAQRIGEGLLHVAGGLVTVVLAPVLAFLLVKDAPAIRRRLAAWSAQRAHAAMWQGLMADVDRLLGRYMRALVLLSILVGVVYGLAFTLAGVPFGLVLAIGAGVLEFVPVAGPALGALGVLGVAALSGYAHLAALAAFLAAYRLLHDYVVSPWLMSGGASLPPLLVLLGLVAGAELGGLQGVFLSVPVIAALRLLALHVLQEAVR